MRSSYKDIKKTKAFPLLLCIFLCLLLCGCTTEGSIRKKVHVTVVDSVFFTSSEAYAEVEAGENVTLSLKMRPGFDFYSCDYDGYAVQTDDTGNVLLTLEKVTRPARVTVQCKKTADGVPAMNFDCAIDYDLNGGSAPDCGDEVCHIDYRLTKHLRPNTWNGRELKKEGYTLYGWNTEKDGSGEHIGLGSRVTVPYGQTITLYAEWLKQIGEEYFLASALPDGTCTITGYRGAGNIEPFVLPSEIGGREVSEIASSFTVNMPCGKLTSDTLVLPDTVKRIRGNSFLNSCFSELVFFDNLEYADDNAFPYSFKTYRINAYRAPCFQDKNNSTLFSDNIDRLILNADKRKLILFSGCSFAYGVNSRTIDEALGGKYVVFNMGMNGDINGAFQMEILLHYMGEGDVLLHAPEEMSQCQLMFSQFTNNTMFVMTEGNYDLLSLVDFSGNGGVIRAFFDYIELKNETEECSYSDGRNSEFNLYGDYICERPYDEETEVQRDVTYSDNAYCYEPSYLTEQSVSKLAAYYAILEAKGGKALLSYAPVNISARDGKEIREKGLEFAAKFEEMLGKYGVSFISDVEDYMFPGRYFYDSDYHLNDLGAAIRTERLIRDLLNAKV